MREFQRKHPEEFKEYAFIYPITLATHMALIADRISDVCHIAERLQRQFGGVPGISEFAEEIIKHEQMIRQRAIIEAQEMERLKGSSGAICQFEWSDGYTREVGLLVLRDGDVVKREVWFEEYVGGKAEEWLRRGVAQPNKGVSNKR
ncbi:hypothetical protein ACPDIT_01585 [Limisphaera sp. VF-2]